MVVVITVAVVATAAVVAVVVVVVVAIDKTSDIGTASERCTNNQRQCLQ